jgi:hypothetical protein
LLGDVLCGKCDLDEILILSYVFVFMQAAQSEATRFSANPAYADRKSCHANSEQEHGSIPGEIKGVRGSATPVARSQTPIDQALIA